MDTIKIIEQIVSLGYEMRVKQFPSVVSGVDVTLVRVDIGAEFSGEAPTPAEALADAFKNLLAKVQRRHESDAKLLSLAVRYTAAVPVPVAEPPVAESVK